MSKTVSTPSNYSNGSTDMNSRYALTYAQVNTLITELNSTGFLDNVTKLFTSPVENIISLYKFPFDVKSLSTTWSALSDNHLIINVVTMTNSTGTFLNPVTTPLIDMGSMTIAARFGSFLDYAPYTTIDLYLPYVGWARLDNNLCIGKTINIKYAVDLYSGRCTAFVIVDDVVITQKDGQIGMQIQIAGGSGADLTRAMLKFGLSTAAGAVSLGAGATTAGVAQTVSSGAGYLAGTTINAISAGQIIPQKEGTTNANNGFYGPQSAYLVITRPVINRPSSYNSNVGRPSGATHQLSELTGYTVVDSVHVEGDGLKAATQDELSEIERLLKSGVIL